MGGTWPLGVDPSIHRSCPCSSPGELPRQGRWARTDGTPLQKPLPETGPGPEEGPRTALRSRENSELLPARPKGETSEGPRGHMGSEVFRRVEARLLSPYRPRARQLRREHDPKPGFLCQHQGEGLRRSDRVSAAPHCAVCLPPREALPCPPRASPAHVGGPGRLERLASHTLWSGPGSNGLQASLRGPRAARVYGRHTPFVGSQGPSAPEPGQGSSVLRWPLGCSRPGHPLKLKTGLRGPDRLGNRTQAWRAQGSGGSR